jgi:protein-S-isoprenylcysteine O-methyltransferase Ste14
MQASDAVVNAHKRRSQIGFGIFVIALVMLIVVTALHQVAPSESSPILFVILAGAAIAGLVDGMWCDREAEKGRA